MAKASEKKRKLEPEQLESNTTSKRLKSTSKKRAEPKSSQNGKDSKREAQDIVGKEDQHVEVAFRNGQTDDSSAQVPPGFKKARLSDTAAAIATAAPERDTRNGDALENKHAVLDTVPRKKRKRVRGPAKFQTTDADTLNAQHGWLLSRPTAGRYIDHDPIFVQGEGGDEYLIAANTREVQLLSLESSLCVRSHLLPERRKVTSFSLSPTSDQIVEIAYENGEKIQWNWSSGETTKSTFPGREHISALTFSAVPSGQSETLYIARIRDHFEIVLGRRSIFSTTQELRHVQSLGEAAYIIATGPHAIILGERKKRLADSDYIWVEVPVLTPVLCADARLVPANASGGNKALSPDFSLAIGNADGKIHLYSDVVSVFAKPRKALLSSPQTLHWHHEAVSAVKFSKDGNYLISGGKETVLVLWQLETGRKQFLPHLTSEIERIAVSPDGAKYALQMGDNSIMVLSTSELKPTANFAGLQLPVNSLGEDEMVATLPAVTAVIHPKDPRRLLLTVPSSQPKGAQGVATRPFLQTFDMQDSRHLSRQALARNNVTDFASGPEGTMISPPDVSLLNISADGQWLATVDEWILPASDLEHAVPKTKALDLDDVLQLEEEQGRRREVYLKFWYWSPTSDMWTLSTRVDGPHVRSADADLGGGAGRIFHLASASASNLFATVGEDGLVRIWRPKVRLRYGEPMKDENGADMVEWVCRDIVPLPVPAYAGDRADSPLDELAETSESVDKRAAISDACLAFSDDGSLLACATTATEGDSAPLVHLISPQTGQLAASKSGLAAFDQEIGQMAILGRFCITVSLEAVRVWNLIDNHHHYTVGLGVYAASPAPPMFAANHADGTFAIISKGSAEGKLEYALQIYSPRQTECLWSTLLPEAPAAVLVGPGTKGYTLLFENGTIRKLSTNAFTSTNTKMPDSGDPAVTAPGIEDTPAAALDIVKSYEANIEGSSRAAAEQSATMPLESGDDDRAVVRPEQLAAVFDIAHSFAMPPVRDMFQAVVELFARKPLPPHTQV